MMPMTPSLRRGLFAVLAATGFSGAGLVGLGAVLAAPAATGATDPCAASEVARTVGSVAKSTGDYLDSHPETNQVLTSALQQGGPQSAGSIKTYFDANPKVALDMQGLANPLNKLGTQCKLPVSLPQALSLVQAAQGGGLPGPPAGGLPAAGASAAPANGTGPLPGPKPGNG